MSNLSIKCPYCGKKVREPFEFCNYCWKSLYRWEKMNIKNSVDAEKIMEKNSEFVCINCKSLIEEWEEKCSHCWLELIWNLPNNDEYVKNLRKLIYVDYDINWQKIEDKFNYYKNEVFYKNDIPSKFNYYFRRYLVVICFLLLGVILWIIPLCLLFGGKKPRNKYLLVKKDVIWIYEKWWIRSDNKDFFSKSDITGITVKLGNKSKKNSVNIYIKCDDDKRKDYPSGIFHNVYELDKLVETLNKYWYNVKKEYMD